MAVSAEARAVLPTVLFYLFYGFHVHLPLCCEECVVSSVNLTESGAVSGWSTFCGYWNAGDSCPLVCRIDACACHLLLNLLQTYLQMLTWYDEVIRSDQYVIGSTIFCLEIPGWQAYDISPLTNILIAYMNSQ